MKVRIANGLRERLGVIISFLSLLTIVSIIAACGGGVDGSGGMSGAIPSIGPGVSPQVVSGVAATGSPLVGQVTLRDSSSSRKDKATIIASDGSFSIDVADMRPPYLLKATGTADGARHTLFSFADQPGTANINPLTSVALANAAGVDDPALVFDQPDSAALERIRSRMAGSVTALRMKIMPLLTVFNAGSRDPHKHSFVADHDGLDGMFDNVRIALSNGILTITNVATGAVILTAQVRDFERGKFTDDHNDLPKRGPRPPAPTGVKAVGGDGQVTISWDPVPNATSYDLFYTTRSSVAKDEEEDEDEDDDRRKVKDVTSPFVLTGLAPNTTYFFSVRARENRRKGPPSTKVSATTTGAAASPIVLGAPTGLTATGGTNQVTISWPAVIGATSYNLYWSDASGVTTSTGTQVVGVTSPAVLTSLADNTTYYVIVTAVNGAGEGAASVQVAATTLGAAPPPTTAPAAPSVVNAMGGNEQVTVSWSAVAGATSYNIYWSTTSGVTTTTGTLIAGVTSPFVHTGRTASTPYFYIVTAVNGAGESSASGQVTATTNAPPLAVPAAPTGVAAVGGNQQVSVSWNAVSGATSYNLYWSTTMGVTVGTGTMVTGVTSPFVHAPLADNTAYYYIVTAANSAGEGSASSQATATTNTAPPPPASCTLATAVPTCSSCHGNPPPAPHQQSINTCALCHGPVNDGSGTPSVGMTATQSGSSCVLGYPFGSTHNNGTVNRGTAP